MRTSSALLGLILLFLAPAVSFAHDFQQTDGLFFNANAALYRQKEPDRPWQLVSLSGLTIKQSVVFNGWLYIVTDGPSGQSLFIQDRSLRFNVSSVVPVSSTITLKVVGDWLMILATDSNKPQLFVATGDSINPATTDLITTPQDLDRLITIGDQLIYISQAGSTTAVWRYQNSWLLSAQVSCDSATIIRQPQLLLNCADGRLFYPDQTATIWSVLDFPVVRNVVGSESLLLGWDKTDNHLVHLWHSGQTTTINLPSLSFGDVQQSVVSGNRVLFQSAGVWSELLWQASPPTLLQIAASPDMNLVVSDQPGQLFLSGSVSYLSATPGDWPIITMTGGFNHAQKTPTGWLIWQADGSTGSLTQFAPTGSTNFIKVNPWSSATSPIQALTFGDQASYVSVITASGTGNVNLYQTTDYLHWSRLTLPTKPTITPTIAEARALPAGSLVELGGILTVGPGVVGSEISYLADEMSGIQLYLSQTIGNLPPTINHYATATGEISTSQVKRVSLSSLNDLQIGAPAELSTPTITADQAVNNQGRAVLLTGSVGALDTDTFSLQQLASLLKVHFPAAKTIFQKDDQLSLPAIVDWNSSSGQVEAWTTSSNYQLISRAPVTSTATTSSTSSTSTGIPSTSQAALSHISDKAGLPIATTPTTDQAVLTAVSRQLPSAADPILVAAETTANPTTNSQTTVLIIASLIAGLLAMQGRRFRAFTLTRT